MQQYSKVSQVPDREAGILPLCGVKIDIILGAMGAPQQKNGLYASYAISPLKTSDSEVLTGKKMQKNAQMLISARVLTQIWQRSPLAFVSAIVNCMLIRLQSSALSASF